MERETRIKTNLNGNPNSLQYRSFVPKTSQNGSSFSSYLKPEPLKTGPGEDTVTGTIDDCDQISVFDAEDYFSEERMKPAQKMENNNNLDCSVANLRLSSISSTSHGQNFKVSSFRATPTGSSEVSWNSQTGLLTNPQGSAPVSLRTFSNDSPKRDSKTVNKWFLVQKCPCFGKKSVQVEGKIPNPTSISSVSETNKAPISSSIPSIFDSRNNLYSTIFATKKIPNSTSIPPILDMKRNPNMGIDPINVPKAQSSESHRTSITVNEQKPEPIFPNFRRFSSDNQNSKITHLRSSLPNTNPNGFSFSFPILNPNSINKNLPNPLSLEDPPRESLEIFQPAPAPAPERVRRNYSFPVSPMSRIASGDDDVASDASSDLFEIDSFSNIIYRDSLDEATTFHKRGSVDSVAASECYAPSEASVEWSVATGEGYGSVANFSASVSQVGFGAKYEGSGGGGEGVAWHALGMGCRGEKAVRVVGPRLGKEGGAWGGAAAWEGW